MLSLVARRVAWSIPLLVIVTFIVFLMLQLAPGDPARIVAGEDAGQAEYEAIREQLGLNDPLHVQYGSMMSGLLRGDMGTSILSSQSVAGAILDRLPITLSIATAAAVFAILVSLPAGLVAGLHAGRLTDWLVTSFTTMGISAPNFFVGLLLVMVVALGLGWLPATGYRSMDTGVENWLSHIILPAVALGVATAAELTRHLRAAVRDVLKLEYVRTARAKGLPMRLIIGKHVLKNAAMPVMTVMGLQAQQLLSGAVVIESVFAIPGMGSLLLSAVVNRDFPMIQGVMLFVVLMVVVVNLVVDVSYGLLNPKVRTT